MVDVQRQGSVNEEFTSRNGHHSSKAYNERSGFNGGAKWYNEKRGGNSRRSDEPRSKSDFNYREQSSGRSGNTNNAKQRSERDIVSADRESNSSVENNSSRRRQKPKNNQNNAGKIHSVLIQFA